MHRVATQQAGTLDQIVLGALAHDDGTQAQAVAAAGLLDHDARQQAADATEAVEHHVGALALLATLLANHLGQLFADELLDAAAVAFLLELDRHAAEVDGSGAQLQSAQDLQDREGVVHGQLGIVDLTGEAVHLENADYRTFDQAATIDRGHHIVVAVELADQRNHGLGKGLAVNPLTKALVGLLGHGRYLPHVGVCTKGYIMTVPTLSGNVPRPALTAGAAARYNRAFVAIPSRP
ncbi:hypothetical protein D3C78_1227390 [compost metagenome]